MFTSNNKIFLSILLAMTFILAGCGTTSNTNNQMNSTHLKDDIDNSDHAVETVELTISAAASLTDALTEIMYTYEDNNPHVHLNINFGGSGALQQQIEQGAPVDIFMSAAVKNMNALVDEQLIDADQQINLLKNELVVVTPQDNGTTVDKMSDLTKDAVKIIAIGIPESVPAGNYAKAALTTVNLWDVLQDKTVQAKDVRQVLQYLETGNADAGFVYKTDALTSDKVKVAFTVDQATYPAVQYPIGIVKATRQLIEAEHFYTYLQSQEALDVFIKYGFSSLNE
ncbi:molybdate ABC transporter substrate-binding protein [Paenibacillus crassostreae]|uniref:Molybdenum ABC transporter substrate-binding protein n=1 Tax=Paenibacillus crassostreae TaxID=1763538 RepID=A0A167FBN6_9BACL|nr:molybdate ABC transporter substrate-binding protein [Paenibacillus crassostreae]AOZ90848.1 molybdate ABC transporter substrate-binding protein [Paenibacillus crassostreae]OAB76386.1 molybdenum ABC transporter substrate-binding protein [Paenibacillus crassostreae]